MQNCKYAHFVQDQVSSLSFWERCFSFFGMGDVVVELKVDLIEHWKSSGKVKIYISVSYVVTITNVA